MKKIPTVFKRDPEDMKHVLPEVTPGCEWVLAGEGVATRKYDGTGTMFDGQTWWARREIKPGKDWPANFRCEEMDETTGKTVGWVPMAGSAFEKWHVEALGEFADLGCVPGTYELCGPKINGNPEGFDRHRLIEHAQAETAAAFGAWTIDYEVLSATLLALGERGIEGIVWHHPDGRMAKLKARDFQAGFPA